MAKIIVKFKDMVRQEHHLTGPMAEIGRSSANDIHIDNLAVSRKHAQITREGDHFVIEDLDSNNGTYLNGERIQHQRLKEGDVIQIGKHVLQFVAADEESEFDAPSGSASTDASADIEMTMLMDSKAMSGYRPRPETQAPATPVRTPATPPPPPGPTAAAPAARKPSPQARRRASPAPSATPAASAPQSPAYLTVLLGGLSRARYDLNSPATTIGKGDAAEIRLKGMLTPNLAMVVNRRPDGYYVTPSGGGWSKPRLNGSTLKDQRKLSDGDILEIREYKFQFNLPT